MRRAPLLFASAVALILATLDAKAETQVCNSLRAQLASLGPSRPAPAPRAFGCRGGFFARLFSGCGPFTQNFDQESGFNRQRSDILQAMARWHCSGSSSSASAGSSGGAVRTLCVRSCDGYFFPISSSANRKRVKIDDAVCHAMYPGGDAQLYTQRYDGDPNSDMKSLRGETSPSQPFAYRYRTVFDPGCAAELKRPASSPVVAATPIPEPPDASGTSAPNAVAFDPPDERAERIVGPVTFYTLPDAPEQFALTSASSFR